MTLKDMLYYCFGGAVVCLTQDTYQDETTARRIVLLYLPDGQKMTVGALRALADRQVVSISATGLAEDPAWKQRVEISLLVPERLMCRAAKAVRTGALQGESWIGIPEMDETGSEYMNWERDDSETSV